MGKIITNVKVYDLEESIVASGYAMISDYNESWAKEQAEVIRAEQFYGTLEDVGHYKRALKLTKAPLNSGHPNFLSGILVSMDVTFTNKVFVEWQRYHFQQIVTSQSTMHKLSKFDLNNSFIEYVDPHIIIHLKAIQKEYNENPTKENYLKLVYSCPSGLKLTARVSTNYLQLMTMYRQRRNHRLPEWQQFTQELLELPMFYEFLEVNGILDEKDKRGE